VRDPAVLDPQDDTVLKTLGDDDMASGTVVGAPAPVTQKQQQFSE
jgi:hypothetical protein